MPTFTVKTFVPAVAENPWTPKVLELISETGVEDPAAFIGVADEAEGKKVLLGFQRAANAQGYGARKQYLGVNDEPEEKDGSDAWLVIITVGKKKAKSSKQGDAVAAGTGTSK
jgi:hypothetical protein